jgi:hypothetical protein
MPAIITDQLRVLNAKNFVSSATSSVNSYYVFLGLPNATSYDENWDANPPAPKDNFNEENDYWDTMIALKKVKPEDVKHVVKKVSWTSGTTYDMYRHDISRTNLSQPSEATSLYAANYYVVNSEYKVYICIHNGADPENVEGRPSLDEPTFTDLEPKPAGTSGDGYLWKYLYTIPPGDIVKFDGLNYIPVPNEWGSTSATSIIQTNATTSGQLKNIVITGRGVNLGDPGVYTNVPIKGDGSGAEATIVINEDSKVESITISKGGSGYTYGTVDIKASDISTNEEGYSAPTFDVIIPPYGGHGYDIYRELGSYNVLIYSRIENDLENPDFIVGNQVARFGIIKNPLGYDSDEILTSEKVSAVSAIKFTGNNIGDINYPADSIITQTVSTGTTAIGRVISYDKNTGVLKYWQDRTLVGFNSNGTQNSNPAYGFNQVSFTSSIGSGGNLVITGQEAALQIDTTFGSVSSPGISTNGINNNASKVYYLGQQFIQGLANPEVKKHSGDLIYVDNRSSITRSPNQKEDIKVILQF